LNASPEELVVVEQNIIQSPDSSINATFFALFKNPPIPIVFLESSLIMESTQFSIRPVINFFNRRLNNPVDHLL